MSTANSGQQTMFNSLESGASSSLKRRVARIMIACYVWSIVPILTVFFASMVIISAPFAALTDKKRNILHEIAILWAKSIALCNPWWNFKIDGQENLPPTDRPVVYVANHQSQADIISVFLISRQFRWLAKDSLFKIPFLGWAMATAGYVPVKRGDRRSHVECMKRSKNHLENGTSMLFFPEGTRSRDGKLQPFKAGAFKLASESKVDVVPITLQGASDLLPKGSLVPSIATVNITVHPVIHSQGLTENELMAQARAAIESTLLSNRLKS